MDLVQQVITKINKNMIVKIALTLWFLLIVVYCVVAVKRFLDRGYIYPFEENDLIGIPYVTIDIQGKPYNMLIDSGAALSIIRKDILNTLEYEESERKVSMQTLTPSDVPNSVVTLPITIGKTVVKDDFIVYETDDLANFQKLYGVVLHGILGNEFYIRTKCNIDYKEHRLILNV